MIEYIVGFLSALAVLRLVALFFPNRDAEEGRALLRERNAIGERQAEALEGIERRVGRVWRESQK